MMKTLTDIVNEILLIENSYMIEGIDIDDVTKTVSFNSKHEDNVDTSDVINPNTDMIGNIPVISIFKRKKSETTKSDGNPLISALKGINGWKFKNNTSDIINLLKQFIKISNKIKPIYDTIITVPSNNELNVNFLHRLNKIIKCKYAITDYMHKLTSDDVYENYIDWEAIKNDHKTVDKMKNYFISRFKKMDNVNDGIFSYKYIIPDYRSYIKKTMYSDDESLINYSDMINDKDILILDDTITTGSSVSEVSKVIMNSFAPNSITIITLFSKAEK